MELVDESLDFNVRREVGKLVDRELLENYHRSKRSKCHKKVFAHFQ